jgi:hypothetical protein
MWPWPNKLRNAVELFRFYSSHSVVCSLIIGVYIDIHEWAYGPTTLVHTTQPNIINIMMPTMDIMKI